MLPDLFCQFFLEEIRMDKKFEWLWEISTTAAEWVEFELFRTLLCG